MENENIVLFTDLCEYYGPFLKRYVGTVDMLEALKLNDIGDTIRWTQKYHPKHYFGTYSLTNQEKFQEMGGYMKWDVWVPIKGDNIDWIPKPGTKYSENLRGNARSKKFLPIAWPEKYIDEWIAASRAIPGLYSYSY